MSRSSLLPALILMGISAAWTATLALSPREGEAMAAVYPPGAGGETPLAAASAAGSAVIAFGNLPSIVLVRSDQPGLARRLRATGAWLVVRAPLAAGCLR